MRTRLIALLVLVALVSLAAPSAAQNTADVVDITIINTADEHGWLQPLVPFGSDSTLGGAANIYSWWVEYEGYDPATHLLLSGGDNWTGPSISTWFAGAPMIEAFNLMGYDASAIGNHEFDFGREVMADRFANANYPYLAANIRDAETGELADFAIPYTLIEVNGVIVGIIGLTTTDTVSTTHPRNIGDLIFTDYDDALEEFVPQMREQGAQIIVGLTHACPNELTNLAVSNGDLIDALFAGHCNWRGSSLVNDVSIMGSGDAWRGYARLTISYDRAAGDIVGFDQAVVEVAYITEDGNPVTPDAEVAALVDEWQAAVDETLAVEIGYTETGIERRSPMMGNWITDAWLWAYPTADVAITNWGGMRQSVEAGPITMGDVVGVLPFDNVLIDVEITGAQLAENLACCGGAVGGIYFVPGAPITFLDGREFDPDATYHVLINDFMYFGGDDYLFSEQDPDAYDTGIQWRQPVIDYTQWLATSPDAPLEGFLDDTVRAR